MFLEGGVVPPSGIRIQSSGSSSTLWILLHLEPMSQPAPLSDPFSLIELAISAAHKQQLHDILAHVEESHQIPVAMRRRL